MLFCRHLAFRDILAAFRSSDSIACVSSEESGGTARMHRLVLAFDASVCHK